MGTFLGLIEMVVIINIILKFVEDYQYWRDERKRRKRNEEIERLKETRG